mmetsp:Transcript_67298/g.156234  ORF Transcript_67298/g.156234 Transcript_67298/m.156234 type:complete len:381 (+) Transcript_67298:63-1205(+)
MALLTLSTTLTVAVVALTVWLLRRKRRQPRDSLMELAAGLQGACVPAELEEQITRVAKKRALGGQPPSQADELAMLDASPVPRFELEDPGWLEHLDREGYAVVASVASPGEIAHAKDLLWNFLETATACRRDLPETWSDEECQRVGNVRTGFVNQAGIGQSDFMWYIRTLPRVRGAFERIWGTMSLLVSFDGANIFRPWHHGFRKTICGWWHVDQGAAKQGRHSVQGLVSLLLADATTGGLTVLPKSHLRHAEVTQDMANPSKDYCRVDHYEPVVRESVRRLVSCQPGDLLLWDSRTVHANSPAPRQPTTPAGQLLREVAYVCMTPKCWASLDARRRRRTAYEQGVTCAHWPHELAQDLLGGGCKHSLAEAPPEVVDLVG